PQHAPQQHHSPEQSLYAQQLEEHRLKMQREAEAHEVEAQVHRDPTPEPDAMPRVAQVPIEEPRVEAARVEQPGIEQPRAEHGPQPVQQAAPRYEAPRSDAKEILSSTGLQMVGTDAAKANP